MVGAGVFVITGVAANGLSGPSVILSYIVSGTLRLTSLDTRDMSNPGPVDNKVVDCSALETMGYDSWCHFSYIVRADYA